MGSRTRSGGEPSCTSPARRPSPAAAARRRPLPYSSPVPPPLSPPRAPPLTPPHPTASSPTHTRLPPPTKPQQYEYFKKTYADYVGEENMKNYGTLVYLAGSASAEFFADIALSPFEAVKVAVQTRPGFAKGLTDGMPKLIAADGFGSLFKSLVPLWGRQIPYTMMKFGAFENTVVALYKYAVPKPREECTKGEQLGVSFAAGYIAGVFCAAVSHPADNLVSKLNAQKGATAGDIIKQVGAWRGVGVVIGGGRSRGWGEQRVGCSSGAGQQQGRAAAVAAAGRRRQAPQTQADP
jgi:hypothetical protein